MLSTTKNQLSKTAYLHHVMFQPDVQEQINNCKRLHQVRHITDEKVYDANTYVIHIEIETYFPDDAFVRMGYQGPQFYQSRYDVPREKLLEFINDITQFPETSTSETKRIALELLELLDSKYHYEDERGLPF